MNNLLFLSGISGASALPSFVPQRSCLVQSLPPAGEGPLQADFTVQALSTIKYTVWNTATKRVIMFGIGMQELLVILLIVVIIFGAKRLPELSSSLGKAIRNFRRSMSEPDEIDITPDKKDAKPDEDKDKKD